MSATMKEWVSQQIEQGYSVYFIIDPTFDHNLLSSFGSMNGDARTLLDIHKYPNAAEISPWILSVQKEHIAWLSHFVDAGIVIATQHPKKVTLEHFASLYHANLAGHTVEFRYYQPLVIAPMLEKMENGELAYFQNQHHLGVFWDGKWKTYHAPKMIKPAESQSEAWWKIKEHHLPQIENLPLLQMNLRIWLWQKFPEKTELRCKQGLDIDAVISGYLQQTERPLVERTLLAAIAILLGAQETASPFTVSMLERHQNDDVQYALMALTYQIKTGGW